MDWWVVTLLANLMVAAGCLIVGWTLRGRLRHRQALSIHDDVVQGLVTAKLSFELGEHDRGLAALDETLQSARHLVSELLDGRGATVQFRPPDLRRSTPERG